MPFKPELWERWFAELQQYRREHGDCKVPYECPRNRALGEWVHRQRNLRGRGKLSEDRVRRLEEMGFVWNVRDARWHDRFESWKRFKEENGHGNVPHVHAQDPALGKWVNWQRTSNSMGTISDEHKQLLDDAGFLWNLKIPWKDQFEKWKRYKQKHGHGNVPNSYAKDVSLGRWVATQRTTYRKGILSDERKKLLDDAGFLWTGRNPPMPATGGSDTGNFSGRVFKETDFPKKESVTGGSNVATSKRRAARKARYVKRKAGADLPIIREGAKKTKRSVAAKILGRAEKHSAQYPDGKKSASPPHKDDGHWERSARKSNTRSTRLKKAPMRPQQKNKQIESMGNIKLECGKHDEEQPGYVKGKPGEDGVTDGNFKVEAQEGVHRRIEASRTNPKWDGNKEQIINEEVGDPLELGKEQEKTLANTPSNTTGETSLGGDFKDRGDALVRVLLQTSKDQERMKEEYPIILAANPSPPVGQTEHEQPDYKYLCDKLTTKVYEYKAKITSLKRENQSLKEKEHPITLAANPSPLIGKSEPDELDGAFYKDLCDRMTKWFDGHKAKFTSLKHENNSLKEGLVQKKGCTQVPEECKSMG